MKYLFFHRGFLNNISLGILYKYINDQLKNLILVIHLVFFFKVSIIEFNLKFEYLDKIVFNDMGKGT